ncbi:MAG TPA: hypothetical protein VGA56_25720 [Opitutaceae bacterium]
MFKDEVAKGSFEKSLFDRHLKVTTDVTNGWLAQRLDMGSGVYVSKQACRIGQT